MTEEIQRYIDALKLVETARLEFNAALTKHDQFAAQVHAMQRGPEQAALSVQADDMLLAAHRLGIVLHNRKKEFRQRPRIMINADALYEILTAVGAEIDHHESDLYVEQNDTTLLVIDGYFHRRIVKSFVSEGRQWFDVPFAYMPFWEAKASCS